MNRNKKSASKIRKLIVICSLMVVVIAASTYAWFIGMRTVGVSSFDVEVAVADSLLLSIDGEHWGSSVDISKSNFDTGSYLGNTNKWAGRGLIPMSSVGAMDTGASRMKIFEKASMTTTPGGYRLLASRVDNYSSPTTEEPDGYVVFDLFIKNFSGTQYIEALNILDEEAIYLTTDSKVSVASAGVEDTGIENSVRVAFAQIGRVIGTETDSSKITGISCTPTEGSGVTGICRTAQIWEPNDKAHESNAISWYNTSCLKRTGTDITKELSYSGTCGVIADGTAYPTYAVNDDVTSADNVDIYDGVEYNGYTPNAKAAGVDTFTDTDKELKAATRPTFMMLAPNSITKVRIYIYIEGQDIDNYDFASIGKAISVKFGFTKERYNEEDIAPVLPIDSCFLFNSTTKTIDNYYEYQDNNSDNEACPKSIIIPSTINGTAVEKIGTRAFSGKQLTRVSISEGIKTIGIEAFKNNSITSLKLADSITAIANGAFNINLIKSVSIPDGVTYIDTSTFSSNQISSIEWGASLTRIGALSFMNNKLTSITIPNSVTRIDSAAFKNNQITSAVLPSSITTIASALFEGNKLTSITIPNSVTTIDSNSFNNNLLTSVTIPDSVTTINGWAFYRNKLTSVNLPSSIKTIDRYAFSNNLLTSLVIPDSVTTMGQGVFGYNSLTEVTLPNSLETIPDNSFESNDITELVVPSSVKYIGSYSFYRNEIDSLSLPNGLLNIQRSAFSNNLITSISIPNTVTDIGIYAFSANQISSLQLSNVLETIEYGAFDQNSLTNITIPASVTTIGDWAFHSNYSVLTSVCIEGKNSPSDFELYGPEPFSWDSGYGDSNIIWNCSSAN